MTRQFSRLRWPRTLAFVAALAIAESACPAGAVVGDAKDPSAALNERAPGAKVTKGEAAASALKSHPGKVTDITVERKRGKQVYVIEIIGEKDGAEADVLVDMQTGGVLGIDR